MDELDNAKEILKLTQNLGKVSERLCIVETNQLHTNASLTEIKASLAILVSRSNTTDNTISNSKGFVAGMVATTSVAITIIVWLFTNFITSLKK